MDTKSDAARRLIQSHFEIEPGLKLVMRIIAREENARTEPIKLLEINENTFPTGSVEPFLFGAAGDIHFNVSIAEVTEEEFEQVLAKKIPLPNGWTLESAERHERPDD